MKGKYVSDLVGLTPDSRVRFQFAVANMDEGFNYFFGDGVFGLNNDDSQKNFIDLLYDAGYIKVLFSLGKRLDNEFLGESLFFLSRL